MLQRRNNNSRKKPILTASPILRALIELVDENGIAYETLSRAADLNIRAVSMWKLGKTNPTVINVEIVGGLMGYHLEWVKNE